MKPLQILIFSLSFFGAVFFGKCLYVSDQVSVSICQQHQQFTDSGGELQKAQKSGPSSRSENRNDGCGWYEVKKGQAAGCAAAAASFIECSIIEKRQQPLEVKPENGRIVGGEDAEPHEFPSIVAIRFDGTAYCSSSIVAPGWVVTAAHCIGTDMTGPGWELTAGQHKQSDAEEPSRQRSKIVAYQMHEKYGFQGSAKQYDIAVLKVDPPFELNEQVKAVTLPDPDYRADGVFKVVGWGALSEGGGVADTLQKVDVPLVDDEACDAVYKEYDRNITEDMMCAGYPEGGKDSCQGDSGGPIYKIGDKQILAGIVSWGAGCAQPGFPGVYTEVAYFIDWIKKNTCME